MKNIVLIGMPASGKSTIGVVLAKTLGIGFEDTDLVIQQREHRLLQEIIDSDGLKKFLDAEENAILSLNCENCVISTGGSAVLRQGAMNHLKENGIVIFVDVPIEIIKKRLSNITTRGIAAGKSQSIDEIFNERLPYYQKYADFTLLNDSDSVETAVEKIISQITK